MAPSISLKFTDMKHRRSDGRNTRPSGSSEVITVQKPKRTASRFLICVENKGYAVSLEKRKIYVALSDSMTLKVDTSI
jgi:hypothetical protein